METEKEQKMHHEHHEEHHDPDKKHHGGGFFQWWRGFMMGSLAGLLLSLLVAPQSGRETRALLRYKSLQLKHAAEQSAAEAKEKVDHLSQDARMQVQNLQQRGRAYVEEQRDRATRVASAVKETWQEETQANEAENPLVERQSSTSM